MNIKIVQVNDGANLAKLLKAFPEAEVRTLYAERGQDSWQVRIPLEASVAPEKPPETAQGAPMEAPEEEDGSEDPTDPQEAYIFRLEAQEGIRYWVLFDETRTERFEPGESLDFCKGVWIRKYGKPNRWIRYRGVSRPSEAAMTISSIQNDSSKD